MAASAVEVDAIPYTFNEITRQPEHVLDPILDKLTPDDYKSLFFLLIDVKIKREDFLFLVKKEGDYLKHKFLTIYYEFIFKDALLIEIFGTMQKYDLLKLLGTCRHDFERDEETFTQLSSLWKFLYTVCEQLENGEVNYLKEKLFLEHFNLNVCCAEELLCLAFVKGELDERNWQSKLSNIFKSLHPSCSEMITSYKGSSLKYYPLRRPTKTAHCGIAVIFNHVKFDVPELKERPQSYADTDALKKLWETFGFKIEIHTDLTAAEVYQVFLKLSEMNHSNYDAFVACYLSHGDEGVVVAKDGISNKLTTLVDLIANKCVTLAGKPKLFFVQACQGRGIQTGCLGRTFIPSSSPEVQILEPQASGLSKNVALRSDVLMFNSSIEGFVSFRNGSSSWFVQELVSKLEEYGEKLNISNVLPKVGECVTGKDGIIHDANITNCKQTPVRYSTLNYELKLKKVRRL
ncbi:caspase-8-like isoform X1 [Argiope bruennichi]|uniref:caspase-8-like isoform X1 n=1 Tax=Argiope bruennichi TaxID=94029 RepID=UPI002494D1EB|nr:caspase-8-like isoform X1 [Argiope bruennichi]